MSTFYVSHEGQQQGPYTLEQICEQVKNHQLTMVDYIYDDAKQDWVLFMQHEALAAKLKLLKPTAPPQKPAPKTTPTPEVQQIRANHPGSPSELVAEWFILKGENKFGPFSYTDVVKMMQEKVIFEFDFAWHADMPTWKRVAEVDVFKPEQIRKLKSSMMPEISEVFFRRRHRRMNYNGTILVHDNRNVWKGKGVEISPGGAAVVMDNAGVQPGQTLYLHFKPCDDVPAFNAVCEVVSKQYVEGQKDRVMPIRYSVKFTSVNANTQKHLQELTGKKAVA